MTQVGGRETIETMKHTLQERVQMVHAYGKERGLFRTERDLAAKAGWKSPTQWSRMMDGFKKKGAKFEPTVPTLEGLAKACHCRTAWIRFEDGPMTLRAEDGLQKEQRAAVKAHDWVGVEPADYDWVVAELAADKAFRAQAFWRGRIVTLLAQRRPPA